MIEFFLVSVFLSFFFIIIIIIFYKALISYTNVSSRNFSVSISLRRL